MSPHESELADAAPAPTFRPLHDRVLVRRKPPIEKTIGGIIIPTRAQEQNVEAVVVAIGSGCTGEIVAGDTVLIPEFGTDEMVQMLYVLDFEGQKAVMLRERDVRAKIET